MNNKIGSKLCFEPNSLSKNLNMYFENEGLKTKSFILHFDYGLFLIFVPYPPGVTFLRRKVTKSRRAAARNPLEPGGGVFPSLCKTETRCVPSSAKHFVTHGAPARPPSDRSLAKSGNSCVFISCTNAASDYLEYQKEDRQNWHSFRAGTKRCRLESDLTPYCQ